MKKLLLKNANIFSQDRIIQGDLLCNGPLVEKLGGEISAPAGAEVIDCHGMLALPGLIDEHVHFRDPGMPQKATIRSESRAALLGGTTSFMDMPNTNPPTVTRKALDDKLAAAARDSAANYAFYLGATEDNLEEIKAADPSRYAAIKIYMGATTGNLLLDDEKALVKAFAAAPTLVAVHCEWTPIIEENTRRARRDYGDGIPFYVHPVIRNRDCCIRSTQMAIEIALGTGARLHVLHVSTKEEVEMLRPYVFGNPRTRQISGEAAIPHLMFSDSDYQVLGGLLKCNPAVKTERDRLAIAAAVDQGVLTTVGTDHAPHELAAKSGDYMHCASGCTSVQYALLSLLELARRGEISLERAISAATANVADRYRVKGRGRLVEGAYADIAVVDPSVPHTVTAGDIASPCGWSPFIGHTFPCSVVHTIVNGALAVRDGKLADGLQPGMALEFDRS
ncbi:MAG: amidohydrolase family protein [Succinivibrio sp.]